MALSAGFGARPALAQFAGNATLSANELFRGETVTRNDPALGLGISVESPSGIFAGASVSVAAGNNSPRFATATQYAGYAVRRGETSLELGLIHRTYDRVVDTAYRRGFFEGYVGVSRRSVQARFYVSPDYLRDGRVTYYAEVNAQLAQLGRTSIDGHAGLSLIPHDKDTGRSGLRNFQDWRIEASRPVGQLFVSAGVAGTNYPVYSASGRARVFVALSRAF